MATEKNLLHDAARKEFFNNPEMMKSLLLKAKTAMPSHLRKKSPKSKKVLTNVNKAFLIKKISETCRNQMDLIPPFNIMG